MIIYLTYLLHYTWVKWNKFLPHTTSLSCSQINLFLIRFAHLRAWKLVFCSVLRRVYVRRIYRSIAKDMKFNWSIQVTWKRWSYWLVQQHESWQILQLLSFYILVGAGGLFSRNRLLPYYFESLFTATWKVLQNRCS